MLTVPGSSVTLCGVVYVCADMAAARADAAVGATAAHRYTMADLPRKLIFAESDVTIGEFLGSGAFGNVHKGLLKGSPICIKVRSVPVSPASSAVSELVDVVVVADLRRSTKHCPTQFTASVQTLLKSDSCLMRSSTKPSCCHTCTTIAS